MVRDARAESRETDAEFLAPPGGVVTKDLDRAVGRGR